VLLALSRNTNGNVLGLAEYSFFLLSVIGLLILRRGEKHGASASTTKYRTWIGNPIAFSVVSSLLIARGVMSEPLQGAAIIFAALLGAAVFGFRFGLQGFNRPQAVV